MGRRRQTSKKLSAANSKPLDPLVVFLDESIGAVKVAEALAALGARVEPHREHFPPGTADVAWLAAVGLKGWLVLTRDQRIRYRKLEQNALIAAGVRAFVFTGGSATGDETAEAISKAFPRIARVARFKQPPYIYAISRSGTVTRLL